MRFVSCAAVMLAASCACGLAHAKSTILLSRAVNTVSNGVLAPTGSGLFSVSEHGKHLQQLTPFVAGAYYMPSWLAFQNYTSGVGYWLTTNLSPDGQSLMYLQFPSPEPTDDPYSGKYYEKNLKTGVTQALFAGSDENAAPGDGYLAIDPADGNVIAYANSNSEYPPFTAPCVYLMQADGTDQRALWCAPGSISVPVWGQPWSLAVSSLHWSGNGQKLMAYVSYTGEDLPPPPLGGPVGDSTGYSALFVIDVATGTAVEVGANMVDPPSSDISYDGTKVIYQQYDATRCGNEDPTASGISLCFKDLTTGKVTDLLPSTWSSQGGYGSWWEADWYPEILLSPDGSQAAFTMRTAGSNSEDLYTIRTDGSGLHQLTTSTPSNTAWIPAAWSRNGTRILANRATAPSSSQDQSWPSEIHMIKVSNGHDRFVTDGYALQWLQQP